MSSMSLSRGGIEMNLNQIYVLLLQGKSIFWSNKNYQVKLVNHALSIECMETGDKRPVTEKDLECCFVG